MKPSAYAAIILIFTLLGGGAASAQQVAVVRQTNLDSKVRAWGTVAPVDVFRLKSVIEGRIEAVMVSSGSWGDEKTPLGLMSSKELAAIIDARGTTPEEIVQTRWQKVYKPTRILCPSDCFVLKSFVKARQRVQPNALLFEAAKSLRLSGQVDPSAAKFVRYGQRLEFWPAADPASKMEGAIVNYAAPEPGAAGGGTFSLELSAQRNLLPGTKWEGWVSVATKRKVLTVPTAAVLSHRGRTYVPVEVVVGATNGDLTEVVSGAAHGASVLVITPSKGACADRYKPGPEAAKRFAEALDGVEPHLPLPVEEALKPARGKRVKSPEPETPPPEESGPAQEEDPYAD
ncbi:MAG: efflux RND transporter periplasmic adaptor subunit [Elusimicrobia bacterium]|nr:efflux RND transporter periplasmic adaptor subunit [Elusimicrobiota bacterium]